jgi:hypothetical protein
MFIPTKRSYSNGSRAPPGERALLSHPGADDRAEAGRKTGYSVL